MISQLLVFAFDVILYTATLTATGVLLSPHGSYIYFDELLLYATLTSECLLKYEKNN